MLQCQTFNPSDSNPPTHLGFISAYSVITGGVLLDRFKKKDQKEGREEGKVGGMCTHFLLLYKKSAQMEQLKATQFIIFHFLGVRGLGMGQ